MTKLLPPLRLPTRKGQRAGGEGMMMVLGFVFVVAAVSALVLGVVGLVQMQARPGPVPSWQQAGMAVIQLYSGQVPSWLEAAGEPPASYSIARFIAPVSTVYAFLTTALVLLAERWRLVRVRLAHDHAIVAGGGRQGVLLARSVAVDGSSVVLVDDDAASEAVSSSLTKGVMPLSGVPEDPVVLRRAGSARAAEVFAVHREGHVNAAIALAVRMARSGRTKPVDCYVHVGDSELHAALEARVLSLPESVGFRLHLIDRNYVLAEELVRESSKLHPTLIVVAGDDALSRLVIGRALERWGHGSRAGRPLTACVAGVHHWHAGRGKLPWGLRQGLPGNVSVTSSPDEVDRTVQRLASSGVGDGALLSGAGQASVVVFICHEHDADAMKLALSTLRCSPDLDIEVVACLMDGTGFSEAFAGGPVRLFDDAAGSLRVVAATDILADADAVRGSSTVERLAVALHESYMREVRQSDTDRSALPHAVEWSRLAPSAKESSRAKAWSLGEKMRLIGCAVLPMSSDLTPHEFTDAEIETLARAEHERWCAEKRALGVVHGPTRTAGTHPDLLDWSGLGLETRHKDLAFIRDLPGILAGLGYSIVRLPSPVSDDLAGLSPASGR